MICNKHIEYTTKIKKEKKKERCNQNWMMIIKKYNIRILIIEIIESIPNSKDELNSNHNDGMIIND